MKVKELITELQKCNPNAIVVYDDMEVFEVEEVLGKAIDDTEIDLYDEPDVPLNQAKLIMLN